MDKSAEMSACLELLRLGVMALHGETLGQRATIHGAVREAVGRSALISATLTPLCSPQVLACLLSCMCANVWRVSGVLMRWIWLVASTDAMDALGVLLLAHFRSPVVSTHRHVWQGLPRKPLGLPRG